jgi:hypothetical protein
MANTVTQRTLDGSGKDTYITREIHIISDGTTQETDTVIFSNASFSGNSKLGKLYRVTAEGAPCTVFLEWDQTTDAEILRFNPVATYSYCALKDGGNGNTANPGAAGATGDLLLNTLNLATAGSAVTVRVTIKQV